MGDTDNQSYRSRLVERYATRYPDEDFTKDEVLGAKIADELDEFDRRVKDYDDKNARMAALFTSDPRSAAFLNAWAAGGDPLVFLMETFGDDFRNALESEEGRKAFIDSHNKWLERQAEDRKAREEQEKNFRKSLDDLETFRVSHNLSEQDAVDVFMKVHQIGANVIDGIYAPEDYEMAYRAMNYEKDVNQAKTEGEIAGRNAKIDERLRREDDMDALPPSVDGNGSHVPPSGNMKKSDYDPWGLNGDD